MPEIKITREFIPHGAKFDIGSTPVRLSNTKVELNRGIVIKADKTNTDLVWVGREELNAGQHEFNCGYPLDAGEEIGFEVEDVYKVFVVASSGAQKVYWIGS